MFRGCHKWQTRDIKNEPRRRWKNNLPPAAPGNKLFWWSHRIKLPLTPVLTHRYKQDLIRTGTGLDAFLYLSPHVISGPFIYTVEYILTLGCVEGSTMEWLRAPYRVRRRKQTEFITLGQRSNLTEIRSLWAHTLETHVHLNHCGTKTHAHTRPLSLGFDKRRKNGTTSLIFGPLGALETSYRPTVDAFSHYKGTLTKSTVANVHLPLTSIPYEREEKIKGVTIRHPL